MRRIARLHVLRVFVGDDGRGGNPLGVFLYGHEVSSGRRQAIAAELGFSETVFVENAVTGVVRIFTPAAELGFAGHPLVGTAWLLAHEGRPAAILSPPAGRVATWQDAEGTWIRGRPEWAPSMRLVRLDTPAAVDALSSAPVAGDFVYTWAWEDEPSGRVRARAFAPGVGIAEDEATGAAAVRLGAQLGRPLMIRQGSGSLLLARPGRQGTVEVGGTVVLDEIRTLAA